MPNLMTAAVPAGTMRSLVQPTLSVDQLVVRPWRADDAPAVVTAYEDPTIQRWHVRTMRDVEEAATWIAQWPDRWRAETGADWAVATNGGVVGRVGLNRFDLWDGIGEFAYWVLPRARGQRVAPRAVAAVSRWMFDVLGLHRLELLHSTENVASCRAAARAGFTAEGTLRQQGRHADGWHDMHLHARLADEP